MKNMINLKDKNGNLLELNGATVMDGDRSVVKRLHVMQNLSGRVHYRAIPINAQPGERYYTQAVEIRADKNGNIKVGYKDLGRFFISKSNGEWNNYCAQKTGGCGGDVFYNTLQEVVKSDNGVSLYLGTGKSVRILLKEKALYEVKYGRLNMVKNFYAEQRKLADVSPDDLDVFFYNARVEDIQHGPSVSFCDVLVMQNFSSHGGVPIGRRVDGKMCLRVEKLNSNSLFHHKFWRIERARYNFKVGVTLNDHKTHKCVIVRARYEMAGAMGDWSYFRIRMDIDRGVTPYRFSVRAKERIKWV